MELNAREVSAVLAGLRLLQQSGSNIPLDIDDIATDGGTHQNPDDEWLDALCEKLNSGDDSDGKSKAAARAKVTMVLTVTYGSEDPSMDEAEIEELGKDLLRSASRHLSTEGLLSGSSVLLVEDYTAGFI